MKITAKIPERHKAEPEPSPSLVIGEMMEGEGIYLGRFELRDKNGESLGKIFNMFAAPEDIKNVDGKNLLQTYHQTVQHVAALTNWHDHDGEYYASAKELFKAMEDGSYEGGWVIPPREVLNGRDGKDTFLHPDNLWQHRYTGLFKDAFSHEAASGPRRISSWYWSSTANDFGQVWNTQIAGGCQFWNKAEEWHMSCRPVRFVPVKNAP